MIDHGLNGVTETLTSIGLAQTKSKAPADVEMNAVAMDEPKRDSGRQ